jgi:hypothetical protein
MKMFETRLRTQTFQSQLLRICKYFNSILFKNIILNIILSKTKLIEKSNYLFI